LVHENAKSNRLKGEFVYRSRRDFLAFGAGAVAAAAFGGGSALAMLAPREGKNEKLKVAVGEQEWEVWVRSEGEPLLALLRDNFQIQLQAGPWQDALEGSLLVRVEDRQGHFVEGLDLCLVINKKRVPNSGLAEIVALPGHTYEIDRESNFARYPFFQQHRGLTH
jgi:hypothetical protein